MFVAKLFIQYAFRRPVKAQSDHKPFEAIVHKPFSKVPARLQGMLLQLQIYDLTITSTPSKHMHIADVLSGANMISDGDNMTEKVVYAMEVTDTLSEETLNQLKIACCREYTPSCGWETSEWLDC